MFDAVERSLFHAHCRRR